KVNFGSMLQGIAQDMMRETIKQEAQKGLAKLGEKIFGVKTAPKRDGQTEASALYVQMAKAVDAASPGGTESNPFAIHFAAGYPDGSQANPFHVVVEGQQP